MNPNTLIHADIFFFITSIVTVVLGLVLVVVLYYAAKAAKSVSIIADRIEKESEKVAEDIDDLRERIKEEGAKVSGFTKWVGSFLLGQVVKKAKGSRRSARNADAE
ncbi:MAG TPA: hypothetical protein VGE62_00720 [Candidatus Paceibacterota bacterium]